jgi:CheY-like chemotaxis protein/HPt (histidine-containing phosphotransfer) domain-containing protein
MVDPLRLHQVLSALVTHALRTSRVGIVSLRVQRDYDEPGRVALSFLLNHDGVLENVRELFLPRMDAQGVQGFSMFLVSQLVSALGGKCWAQSFPGRGTAYTVSLTLDVCGQMPEPAAALTGANILLADDLRVNLVVVKTMLERAGHRVTTAMDGEEAVRAFELDTFDLILMDMVMPGMDGLTATAKIRELETTKNLERTPIVALTALSQGDYASEALNSGMDGVLGKPVDDEGLARVLAEHVRFRETPVLAPYDPAELKKRLGGNEKHVNVMLEMFLEVYPGQLAALEEAFRQQNNTEVATLAGHLTGSLESIAAQPAALAAKNLQVLARENRQEAALHARRELVTELERLRDAIQARCGVE